jgi:hypothetical protein
MPKTERTSTVTVELLDMTELEKLALTKANNVRQHSELHPLVLYDRVRAYGGQLAKGTTKDGDVFILNTEGVGREEPLSDDDEKPGIMVDFHAERDLPDGGMTGTMFPVCTAELRLKDVNEMEVTGTANLADFIRQFGSRLESNFRLWDTTLSR